MKKEDYSKISIEHFAKQMHTSVITDTSDFIISKSPTTLQEHSINFDYPHIVEGIALVFFVKGSAKIKINLKENKISQNTLVVFSPNSIIQVLEQTDDLKIEFLFFTFDFISNFKLTTQLADIIKSVEDQTCLHLSSELFEEMLQIHKLIAKQYQKDINYREEIIKGFLAALIYQILQLYTVLNTEVNNVKSRKEDVYMKFMALLFQYYKTERSVQFYADRVFLTPKHFAKLIKEMNGKSASEWIDEIVIMTAKALLKSSELTVAQIADELNFSNPSFFSSYFRKRTGMTPIQYKER